MVRSHQILWYPLHLMDSVTVTAVWQLTDIINTFSKLPNPKWASIQWHMSETTKMFHVTRTCTMMAHCCGQVYPGPNKMKLNDRCSNGIQLTWEATSPYMNVRIPIICSMCKISSRWLQIFAFNSANGCLYTATFYTAYSLSDHAYLHGGGGLGRHITYNMIIEQRSGRLCLPTYLFCKTIMFSDEAQFIQDGIKNTLNLFINNPCRANEITFQHWFSVNVWCALTGYLSAGPFISEHFTAANYLHFLSHELWLLNEDVPLENRLRIFLSMMQCFHIIVIKL